MKKLMGKTDEKNWSCIQALSFSSKFILVSLSILQEYPCSIALKALITSTFSIKWAVILWQSITEICPVSVATQNSSSVQINSCMHSGLTPHKPPFVWHCIFLCEETSSFLREFKNDIISISLWIFLPWCDTWRSFRTIECTTYPARYCRLPISCYLIFFATAGCLLCRFFVIGKDFIPQTCSN